MPKEEGIIDNKKDAYEQGDIKQKQDERMRSLQDFSSLLGENNAKQTDDLALLDAPAAQKASGGYTQNRKPQSSIQSSAQAYHDINRTLGNFYEQPKTDPEKERLKEELEELKARMDENEAKRNLKDEQMALMEKSFQMASKYLPMNAGTTTATAESTAEPATKNVSGKPAVVPVSQARKQIISSLLPEMSGAEFIETYSQPRNTGFFTATAEMSMERRNTISACIHAGQTVMDGESVRLRLLEPMRAGKMLVRENTLLSGFAKIQGERLQITINSLEYNGSIIPVEMTVYDTDGQRGIFIPDTKEINAAKEIVANMGTNAGTSISLSSDAGEQFAADMGRSVIQGVSQFFSKKMREVKVNLKAGYRVFLLPEGNINSQQLANNQ
jgi:conjugative transposon TraM protein